MVLHSGFRELALFATKTARIGQQEVDGIYAGKHIETDIWDSCVFNALLANQAPWDSAKRENKQLCDGLATYVDESKAIGNGQVPQLAATAFMALMDRYRDAMKRENGGVR